METSEPISCSRICSNILIVLVKPSVSWHWGELVPKRLSYIPVVRKHGSLSSLIFFSFVSTPSLPPTVLTYLVSWVKKKQKKQQPSITFRWCLQETRRWTDQAEVASWPRGHRFPFPCSAPLLLQGFNSHRNQVKSLKKNQREHGAYVLERGNQKTREKS